MERAATRSASKWLVLAAVGASTFMAALDGSVVNVALPVIGEKFGQPLETMQWVITAYVLAISSLLLVWGKLADGVGYSKILGSAPRERQGIASALLAASRTVGMVTGVAAAALVLATLRRRLAGGGAAPGEAFLGAYRRTLTLAAAVAVGGAGLSMFRPKPPREGVR